jgi:NAD(P)-dependent dehydrogenase (short-subunit alcohol dehydrogenase family)
MHPLHGKVVLITGASSGIGRATALRLAGHGARLVLAARTADALESLVGEIHALGSQGLDVLTDVTDSEQCRHAVERAVDHFGRLDILICSAGLSMRGYFEDSRLEAFEQIMRINFLGTLYATFHALPHVKRVRGSLVAVSSVTGKRGVPAYSAYGASKFAIQGLYESLHLELKRDGVHVGIVSPGYVDTPILQKVLRPDGRRWDPPPPLPYRPLPVEKCVDVIVRLLVKRRREAFLPRWEGLRLLLDRLFGSWIGDWLMQRKFPPEWYRINDAKA